MPAPKSLPTQTASKNAVLPAEGYVKFSDKLTDSLQDITRMINEHKAMIDAIQEVGIQLTGAIGSLHTITIKYARVVNNVLDILLPLLQKFPLVPPQLLELAKTMEKITQNMLDTSEETAKTISEVNTGLKTGNVEQLKAHAGQIQGLTKSIRAILPE